MSEALPYIVFAGSIAAVFVGIGMKIMLEESSAEEILSMEIPASNAVETVNAPTEEVPQSITSNRDVSESYVVRNSHEVNGSNDSVSGNVSEQSTSKKRKRRKRVGKRLERKIVKLYKKGKSPKEIAEELGISTSTVYRKLKKITSVRS